MLVRKIHLNKFKIREIMQCLFSGHKEIKLKINKKIIGTLLNTWRLNCMLIKNTLGQSEISEEVNIVEKKIQLLQLV